MALVTLDSISFEIGDQKILDETSLAIENNERICLIGRNGAGKSTLLKLITGEIEADSGEIQKQGNIRISQLAQCLPEALDFTVHEYVLEGLQDLRVNLDTYHELSQQKLDKASLRELENLQHDIEAHGGWNLDQRVNTILSELGLPAETRLGELSGGWRRRVSLARALVNNPDLLLLDEPTNHLDISTIQWLENRINGFSGSILFVTHDRAFLKRIANRIIELDRGRLSSWPGGYEQYLIKKEKFLEDEAKHNSLFDKRLAEEEIWIRQGIKARRTRNEGRVRALESMREEYAQRLKPQNKARIHVEEAEQSGRKVIEARNLHHSYGDNNLINGLSLKIMRGDRIGLVGNNGVGKSTLLRILLGEITANSGSVKKGSNVEIAYFDQLRRNLDPEKTVAEIVGDGADYIKLNGKERHVVGYLRGFLFSAKRAMSKIKVLSGGECNRVILAKLLTRPSNLLVLDEPTNDLDVETLEVLEDRLCEYQGTLIAVSHDRQFLDNIVTSILVFEDSGKIETYVGGFSGWLKHGRSLAENETLAIKNKELINNDQKKITSNTKKLSYKLKRELESLPDKIDTIERNIKSLQKQTAADDFYNQPYEQQTPVLEKLSQQQSELDIAIHRWTELESMQAKLK